MIHSELTEKIIGCAFEVHREMGPGFAELVYEKCMLIELGLAGLEARSQVPVDVNYRGQSVGDYIVDLLVDEKVIVELKAVLSLNEVHEVQLVNYLVATGKQVGLLLNFGGPSVQVKRKVPVL